MSRVTLARHSLDGRGDHLIGFFRTPSDTRNGRCVDLGLNRQFTKKRFKVYDIQLQIRKQAGKCKSLQLREPREASGGAAFPGRSQTLNLLQHSAVVVGF